MRALLKGGGLIALGMLLGRLLGLAREMLLAGRFGTGPSADFAVLLLIIPDFVAAALIGGAASAVLVPAFAARSAAQQRALLWQVLWWGLILCLPASALVLACLLPWAETRAAWVEGAMPAAWLALLALPLSVATAVFSAWLQYAGRLRAPAFANVTFNAALMLVLWLAAPTGWAVAAGIVCGAAFRLGTHALALRGCGMHPAFALKGDITRAMGKAYLAATGTALLSMLPVYIPYLVVAGSRIAVFNYAFKLLLLPGMLGLTVISMMVLPWLAKRYQQGHGEFVQGFRMAMLACGLVGVALTLALLLAAPELAALLFGYGAMLPQDVGLVAGLFRVGLLALVPMLMGGLLQQGFYARADTATPLRAGVMQAALCLPLALLGEYMAGLAGVMAAVAALNLAPCVFFALRARRAGLLAGLVPGREAFQALGAAVAVLLLAGGGISALQSGPIMAVALYGLAGLVSLAAGLAVCPSLRNWSKTCFR